MKIKVQNKNGEFVVNTAFQQSETEQFLAKDFPQTNTSAFSTAVEFMRKHPKIVEITFDTQLTVEEEEFES